MPFNTPATGRGAEFPVLKPLTTETARLAQQKAVQSRLLNKEIREAFKRNAKAFQDVLEDIPDFSPLEVLKMCIHLALQDNDYEAAARWSKELAEYKAPKLARKESEKAEDAKDLTDEELAQKLKEEGLE